MAKKKKVPVAKVIGYWKEYLETAVTLMEEDEAEEEEFWQMDIGMCKATIKLLAEIRKSRWQRKPEGNRRYK